MIISMLHMPFLHAEDAGIVVKCSRTGNGTRTAPASARSSQSCLSCQVRQENSTRQAVAGLQPLAMFNSG
jgi:hypothetical protein